MSLDTKKPIVWTTKGNMNECDLDQFGGNSFKVDWQVVLRDGQPGVIDHIVFVKEHYFKGELVKREPHILKPNGCESTGETSPST